MKKFICMTFVVSVMLTANRAEAALLAPILTSYASSAPNVFGSSNWGTYLSNAIIGIDNSGSPIGISGTPGHYQSGLYFDAGALIVTGFPSWMGDSTPGVPFDGEYGNRIHFGLEIEWQDSFFSLSQVSFSATSSDPSNALATSGNFAGSAYSQARVGINYGPDKTRGTGDDIVYNAGETGTNLVNLLLYVGIGNAFSAGDDAEIADTIDYILTNGGLGGAFIFQNTYYLDGGRFGETTAQAIVLPDAAPVPEPSTFALIGIGGLGMLWQRRRKAQR